MGARIPSGRLGKEINILLSPGIEPRFLGRTVLISFNISVLLSLIVVEGVETMTEVYTGASVAMKFHRISYV